VDSFAQSSDGVELIANGIDPVLRWDGYSTVATPAGVTAPTAALTLAASGVGAINGQYFGWVRFVDSFGNVSNLSPISAQANAINASTFTYTNVPVPTQSTVVRRQLIRNTNGSIGADNPQHLADVNVAYVDIDTTDLGSTTFTSTRLDPNLATQESVDIDVASIINGVPPDYKPFLAWHQNRMYFLGVEPYVDGSVLVTFGSNQVQGYGTEWKATFVNRLFYTPNASQSYTIVAVDLVNQRLTLDSNYSAATDNWAQYSIKPVPGEENAFQWSQPNNAEACNPEDVQTLPEDGDRPTGLMNYGSYLYFFKTKHMYRLIVMGDPATDSRLFLALNRGSINNRSWVVVDEVCYLMDQGGIYAYRGDDQGQNVSTPINDMFTTIPGTGPKINWNASRYFHSCHSPNEEVVRWFVALASDFLPRHQIVYAYKLDKIWIERIPARTGASVLSRIGLVTGTIAQGTQQYYVGSAGARVLAPGGTALDGNPTGGNPRGQATSAGWLSLTDVNANFSPDMVNCPVSITKGKGRGQYRIITAQTQNRLTLDRPWLSKPDSSSKYCVGGVPFSFASQRLRWAAAEAMSARGVEIEFEPNKAPNELRVALAPDFSPPLAVAWPIDKGIRDDVTAAVGDNAQYVDLTKIAGHTLLQADSYREGTVDGSTGRTTRLILSGVANEEQVRIGNTIVTGATG
jgi:hypothetical protein